MSALGGFLNGLGDGIEREKDRAERERDRSLAESYMRMQRESRAQTTNADAAPGGAPYAGAYTYDGKISDRPRHAYDRFVAAGLPGHVAAGLVGNLMQESGTAINPAAVGDSGNAFGAGQWNGDRKRAYMTFAKGRGANPTDFDTQIDFLLHEGQTSEKGAWSRIMATKTPEEAARTASKYFWRPGDPRDENRVAYANAIYGARPADPASAPAKSALPEASEPADWPWFRNYMRTPT